VLVGGGSADRQILADGGVEQVDVLVACGDQAAHLVRIGFAQVDAVDADRAAGGVQGSRGKGGEGGFSGAAGTGQGDLRSGAQPE
jgi:hypothetical protein